MPCRGVRGFRLAPSAVPSGVCSTRRPRLVSPSLPPSPSSARSTEQRASVALDVRRDPAVGVLVGPRVLLDDQELDLTSVGVLGDPAHGVFSVGEQTAGVQKLIVARLDQLLSRELRQLVVDPHSLMIPPEDEAHFLTDFIPRLRQKMSITSTDRSVRLPDYVEPIVGVVVHFRPEHRVRLDWMVHYDSPGAPRRTPSTSHRSGRASVTSPRSSASWRNCRCRTQTSRSWQTAARNCSSSLLRTYCWTAWRR